MRIMSEHVAIVESDADGDHRLPSSSKGLLSRIALRDRMQGLRRLLVGDLWRFNKVIS